MSRRDDKDEAFIRELRKNEAFKDELVRRQLEDRAASGVDDDKKDKK
jgi:hypothetical protein